MAAHRAVLRTPAAWLTTVARRLAIDRLCQAGVILSGDADYAIPAAA